MQIEHSFRSLSEWIRHAEAIKGNDGPAASRSSIMGSEFFTHTKTKEEAFQLFYMGCPKLSTRMKEILGDLTSDISFDTIDFHFKSAVAGSSPNVEAYLQGHPEDMFVRSQKTSYLPPTYLPIQLELCFSARFQPDTVITAGAIIHAAITALQMQGCQTEITMTHTVATRQDNEFWQSSVPLPPSIDLDSLAFLLAHPSTLRRIVFSIMEHEPPTTRQTFGFYHGRAYAYPSIRQLPNQAAMLQMQRLCNQLISGIAPRTLLNQLIDTRFYTHTPTPTLIP